MARNKKRRLLPFGPGHVEFEIRNKKFSQKQPNIGVKVGKIDKGQLVTIGFSTATTAFEFVTLKEDARMLVDALNDAINWLNGVRTYHEHDTKEIVDRENTIRREDVPKCEPPKRGRPPKSVGAGIIDSIFIKARKLGRPLPDKKPGPGDTIN
jgi:hypothetical protein